jgi:hypothetical protein
MRDKSVPRTKIINGKRYKLASQDVSKSKAKNIASKLREGNRFNAVVLPLKGAYRVYSKRNK